MFVEIHPPQIERINPKYLEKMFDRLFSLYTVEFIRNHWGVAKTKGLLSVIDEPGCYDWELADHDNIITISKDIIRHNIQPSGFGLHCFCRLEDLIDA